MLTYGQWRRVGFWQKKMKGTAIDGSNTITKIRKDDSLRANVKKKIGNQYEMSIKRWKINDKW